MQVNNLTGQTFGRLTVIERGPNDKHGRATWVTQCVCGQRSTKKSAGLVTGDTKSCGCLLLDFARTLRKLGRRSRLGCHLVHGHAAEGKKTLTYNSWHSMLQRCTNPGNCAWQTQREQNETKILKRAAAAGRAA